MKTEGYIKTWRYIGLHQPLGFKALTKQYPFLTRVKSSSDLSMNTDQEKQAKNVTSPNIFLSRRWLYIKILENKNKSEVIYFVLSDVAFGYTT
jgi:hypothetical protein